MRFSLWTTTLLALFLQIEAASACACCAEPGERYTELVEADEYIIEEFDRLTGERAAQLFLTDCGEECVLGISEFDFDYDVDWNIEDMQLRIVSQAPAGSIAMVLTETYDRFSVDTAPMSHKRSPSLYTEFRFTGEIRADGIFVAAEGAKAELVLAGQTNHCWGADDLSHWILQVNGPEADFRLFGGLSAQ